MKTQAWGWLAAAVMAAGLNASYHDGGLRWLHEFASQVQHNSNAVLALATGNTQQFLAEARILAANEHTSNCPFSNALARVENSVAVRVQQRMQNQMQDVQDSMEDQMVVSDAELAGFQGMDDRQAAQLVRLEATRARMEARLAHLRIPAVALNRVVVPAERISICPRMRVNVPRIPAVRVPALPTVHVEVPGAGPV